MAGYSPLGYEQLKRAGVCWTMQLRYAELFSSCGGLLFAEKSSKHTKECQRQGLIWAKNFLYKFGPWFQEDSVYQIWLDLRFHWLDLRFFIHLVHYGNPNHCVFVDRYHWYQLPNLIGLVAKWTFLRHLWLLPCGVSKIYRCCFNNNWHLEVLWSNNQCICFFEIVFKLCNNLWML